MRRNGLVHRYATLSQHLAFLFERLVAELAVVPAQSEVTERMHDPLMFVVDVRTSAESRCERLAHRISHRLRQYMLNRQMLGVELDDLLWAVRLFEPLQDEFFCAPRPCQ